MRKDMKVCMGFWVRAHQIILIKYSETCIISRSHVKRPPCIKWTPGQVANFSSHTCIYCKMNLSIPGGGGGGTHLT